MTALGSVVDDVIDEIGRQTGITDKIRREAETGARAATRTPLVVVGVIAVAGLVVATVALLRRS